MKRGREDPSGVAQTLARSRNIPNTTRIPGSVTAKLIRGARNGVKRQLRRREGN
jgi:hypothetical protein